MILEEFVDVKVGNNAKYYENKGYQIGKHKNKGRHWSYDIGSIIKVKVEDLSHGCHSIVTAICDVCGEQRKMDYKNYCKSYSNGSFYVCIHCKTKKQKATYMERYGVEYLFQSNKFKDAYKNTMIERYGVDSPLKSELIKEKSRNTCMKKYGVDSVGKVEEFKEKIRKSNMDKYGSSYYMGTSEFYEKTKQTWLDKYGVEYITQCPEIREKQHRTMEKNGTCRTSKQQKYICNLYNGQLNKNILGYSMDIVVDSNICIEVDFGGHDLCVKLGNITQEEFKNRELIRFYQIKRGGYNQIHLISKTDRLPSDSMLLYILELSKEYFMSTGHTWINWEIDNGIYKNAENKNGVQFDYGELRTIKSA